MKQYTILVVDDDFRIRQGLCDLLSTYYGAETPTLLQAENGSKAIELICTMPVNLVLADIKMPYCTGIEMLERLRNMQMEVCVVMVSGFDDYDLVRNAMKLGASDYLLKPVQESELLEVVENCLRRVGAMACEPSPQTLESVSRQMYIGQRQIEQLLSGQLPDALRMRDENSLPEDQICYLLILDAFCQAAHTDLEMQMLVLELQRICNELLGKDYQVIQGEYKGFWTLVLIPRIDTPPTAAVLCDYLTQRHVKFGQVATTLCALGESYQECLAKLDHYFYDKPSCGDRVQEEYPFSTLLEAMLAAVCSYNFEAYTQLLDDLLDNANRLQTPVAALRQLLTQFGYSLMQRNNAFIQVFSSHKFTEYDFAHAVRLSVCSTRLRKTLLDIVHLYIHQVVEKLSSRDDYTVQKAKSIIQRELLADVSLTMVADELKLHPNYLSVLFKNKTGMTYREYVRTTRIQKACELMKSSNMKLYEIEEYLGYKDHAHFYRSFKEIKGVAPAKYKKELNV